MTEREVYIKSIVVYLERLGSDTFIKRVYALVESVCACERGKKS